MRMKTATPDQETVFFQELGQRIATLRKQRGLTQTALGETLGLGQTVIASYEIGRRRVPVSLLAPLAKALNISSAELLEVEPEPGKRGPMPKLQRQIDQVSRLPRTQQQFVSKFLDTVLQQPG
jgi:transcriptional regulator with XRE-family HTH domain